MRWQPIEGMTCDKLGFDGGILNCLSDCTGYDLSNCGSIDKGYCGDGKIETPNTNGIYEQCDGNTPTNHSWGE